MTEETTSLYEVFDFVPSYTGTVAQVFDFNNPPMNPAYLSNSLMMTMHKKGGYGIAAPQVGINYRVIAFYGEESAMFNPDIFYSSPDEVEMEEGNLTFPGLYASIKRPSMVRVRFLDAHGQFKVETFNGITARLVQHYIEILNGKWFVDNLSRIKKEAALKKWKKEHNER